MSVLLDTHMFVWWVTEPERLTPAQSKIVADQTRPVLVSAAVAWEIAIKVKLAKWPSAAALLPDVARFARMSGLQVLDITMAHAERAGSLPLIHRDPFDRLIAAQALDLDIPVMTRDAVFADYGCAVM